MTKALGTEEAQGKEVRQVNAGRETGRPLSHLRGVRGGNRCWTGGVLKTRDTGRGSARVGGC